MTQPLEFQSIDAIWTNNHVKIIGGNLKGPIKTVKNIVTFIDIKIQNNNTTQLKTENTRFKRLLKSFESSALSNQQIIASLKNDIIRYKNKTKTLSQLHDDGILDLQRKNTILKEKNNSLLDQITIFEKASGPPKHEKHEKQKKPPKTHPNLTVSIGLINDVNSITNLGETIIKKLKRKKVYGKISNNKKDDIDIFIFCYNSQYLPYEDIENSCEELKDLSKTGSVIVLQLIDDSVLENFLDSTSKKLSDVSDIWPSGIFLNIPSLKILDNLFVPTKDNKIHDSVDYAEEVNDQIGTLVRYIKTVAENKEK